MNESEATLTPRQRDVLREMVSGGSNKEIARTLDIRVSTVKSHVRIILEKPGMLSNSASLAASSKPGRR